MKKLLVVFMLMMMVGFTGQAFAGRISVVADVNAAGNGNLSFYDAILGSSEDVLFSRSAHQQTNILNHYNSLVGVTATTNGAPLTAALLGSIDMLVVTAFFNNSLNYTTSEIFEVANFVDSGGTVLMITEAQNPNAAGYNDFLAGIGSSISYTGLRIGASESITAENTSLGSLDPFAVSWYNTLTGGTAVYNARSGTVVAFEDTNGDIPPIPEPGTIILLASGLLGLAGFGRKHEKS